MKARRSVQERPGFGPGLSKFCTDLAFPDQHIVDQLLAPAEPRRTASHPRSSPASARCACRSPWPRFSAARTSATLETVLPPTLRMTSPVWKPCSAAGPSGSTAVTTTPLSPEPSTSPAGASRSPRCGVPAASFDDCIVRHWPDGRSAFRRAPPSASWFHPCAGYRASPSVPGAIMLMLRARSRASLTSSAVDRGDDVTGLDSGLGRRTAVLRIVDHRAAAPASCRGCRRCRP